VKIAEAADGAGASEQKAMQLIAKCVSEEMSSASVSTAFGRPRGGRARDQGPTQAQQWSRLDAGMKAPELTKEPSILIL